MMTRWAISGFVLPVILCLFSAGCMTGPYVERDVYAEDGLVKGTEEIYHDGTGGSEVIDSTGVLPADETGADAILDGSAGDGGQEFAE